ncbi:uncharacterized protein [Miscanthus floridulus]|uniref:uncharacterized protein n=1 Tax=Miscanthus floridulus TaxID=154761 RepID=UPI0034595C59
MSPTCAADSSRSIQRHHGVWRYSSRSTGWQPSNPKTSPRLPTLRLLPPPPPASAADYEDPLTSLSLSLSGLDHQASSGFHYDSAWSHFQEALSPVALPIAAVSSTRRPSFAAGGDGSISVIVVPVQRRAGGRDAGDDPHRGAQVHVRHRPPRRVWPSAVGEACMPQLVDGVMRATAEHVGVVTRP